MRIVDDANWLLAKMDDEVLAIGTNPLESTYALCVIGLLSENIL